MNTVTETTPSRFIRVREVLNRIGIGRSTLYDWINPQSPRFDCHFPKPVKIGTNAVAWLESDIDEWIMQRVNANKL
ncbi:AlpA family transcriptional regulator [Pseudaeromonas sp. ZJS20]|uniref:helix-turn-helix transcriptional regulator n=1 Tax=Pseudaeromonas aegiceratis TaxID=3153928 RepID=UPI00390CC43D